MTGQNKKTTTGHFSKAAGMKLVRDAAKTL